MPFQFPSRKERWQKILISAAKQCGRNLIFPILPSTSFSKVLEKTADIPIRLLAHSKLELPSMKSVLEKLAPLSKEKQNTKEEKRILLMVGPEGGFSDREIELAIESKVHLFSLGSYTLRAETAALASIANLNFYFSSTTYSD